MIYSPIGLSDNRPRSPHRDLDEEARFRSVSVRATLETSLPSKNSALFDELHATQPEFEAYLKLIDPLKSPLYRIGGHADEIQGDVCLQAQLASNGVYCGDSSGLNRGRRKGLNIGAADWRLLLRVDSDERTGMYWGETGRIYFLIRDVDLRLRQFDKVWLVLQCT